MGGTNLVIRQFHSDLSLGIRTKLPAVQVRHGLFRVHLGCERDVSDTLGFL